MKSLQARTQNVETRNAPNFYHRPLFASGVLPEIEAPTGDAMPARRGMTGSGPVVAQLLAQARSGGRAALDEILQGQAP